MTWLTILLHVQRHLDDHGRYDVRIVPSLLFADCAHISSLTANWPCKLHRHACKPSTWHGHSHSAVAKAIRPINRHHSRVNCQPHIVCQRVASNIDSEHFTHSRAHQRQHQHHIHLYSSLGRPSPQREFQSNRFTSSTVATASSRRTAINSRRTARRPLCFYRSDTAAAQRPPQPAWFSVLESA